MQAEFDEFYDISVGVLNRFYPKQTVTVTPKDRDFVTARTKAMLHCKNRLMREGRVEEAGALTKCIGKGIVRGLQNVKWPTSIFRKCLIIINGSSVTYVYLSEYDIRPKPKVWAGSRNECRRFGRMLYARTKQCLLLRSTLSGQEIS